MCGFKTHIAGNSGSRSLSDLTLFGCKSTDDEFSLRTAKSDRFLVRRFATMKLYLVPGLHRET